MAKPNKLCVLHTGDDPEFGGIQRMCHDAVKAFQANGISVKKLGSINVGFFQKISVLFNIFLWRGDFFLFHAGLSKYFLFVRPKGKVFVFLHGVEVWKSLSPRHRLSLRYTTKFLINSSFTWAQFLKFNPEFENYPKEIVHLGLDKPVGNPLHDFGMPVALVISRLDRGEDYKGHKQLISIWTSVREIVPNAELWIAGDGNLKPDLEKQALGKEGIRFFGKVSTSKKEELIKTSRCLAMPSLGEGFGLVYLEAMKYGIPCLVSDSDAGREVVNPPEAGLEISQNDLKGMVDKLVFLLGQSKDRIEMGKRAKLRYESRFTLSHYQHRILKSIGV